MPGQGTPPIPDDKLDRYRKVKKLHDSGADGERSNAERILVQMETEYPGIGAKVTQADRRDEVSRMIADEMRKRGVPMGHAPIDRGAVDAGFFERVFHRAVRWATDTLAENASPDEIIDALGGPGAAEAVDDMAGPEATTGKRTKKMASQADRVRSALENEGSIDGVEFLVEKEEDTEPFAIAVKFTIPWRILDRLGKSKNTAFELADWLLDGIETAVDSASGAESDVEESAEAGEGQGDKPVST